MNIIDAVETSTSGGNASAKLAMVPVAQFREGGVINNERLTVRWTRNSAFGSSLLSSVAVLLCLVTVSVCSLTAAVALLLLIFKFSERMAAFVCAWSGCVREGAAFRRPFEFNVVLPP